MTVQNTTSQIDINSNRGYTPEFRKHIHIKIGRFQEGFLGTTIISFITDIYTHKQINQWNNTKMGKIHLFISMSKVNLGTLPSTQNTFSVLLDSVCAVTAWITNCDKSQIATVVSQFVTVAICDGSKHNFSDWYVIWYVIWYLIWCDVMWYGIWYHMMYDIIPYDIIWYDAISYDIIWYHLIWCYII